MVRWGVGVIPQADPITQADLATVVMVPLTTEDSIDRPWRAA